MSSAAPSVALMWHGDAQARRSADLAASKLGPLAQALKAEGIRPVAAVYCDETADEVREELLGLDGVLVFVNPIESGRDRSVLDALLREVASAGVYVSAHPDTILAMGTKEVLVRTRGTSWGCDTVEYRSAAELRERLPERLAGGPRVLKQYRGNGGNGVWRVEQAGAGTVRARHAQRGSVEQEMSLDEFLARIGAYFEGGGRIIDQAYQERLTDGMVRCYLSGDEVVGFGRQEINALYPAPPGADPSDAPQPGPRLYHPPDALQFAPIKMRMESEWLPELRSLLGLTVEQLPAIWDADLLFGPKAAAGEDTYVLCEINVSSVYPFPDSALTPIARTVARRLSA